MNLARRLRWAELMKRTFEVDVLRCECGAGATSDRVHHGPGHGARYPQAPGATERATGIGTIPRSTCVGLRLSHSKEGEIPGASTKQGARVGEGVVSIR